MLLTGMFICRLGLLFGLEGDAIPDGNTPLNPVTISLPKIAVAINGTLDIPINLSGVNGQNIYSLYLKIGFDPAVINITDVTKTGVTLDWQNPTWNVVEDELRISLYGTSALNTDGNALLISLTAIGDEADHSPLHFNLAALNEGNPASTPVDGSVYIGIPYPYFETLESLSYDENEVISVQIIAHDPLGKTLQLSAENIPEGAVFTDLGGGTGSLDWATDYYDAGDYVINFQVTNSDSLSDEMELIVQIVNVPQAPLIYIPFEDISFDEDTEYQAYELTAYVSDSDLDQGDFLSISLSGNTNVIAQLTDGFIVFSSSLDWYGIETVSLIITDSYDLSVSQQITVTVHNVNDPPYQIMPLPVITIDEDSPRAELDLSLYFADVDNVLIYTVSGDQNIDCTLNGAVLGYKPQQDWFGTETVTITATEGALRHERAFAAYSRQKRSLSISDDLIIHVLPVNDPPMIVQPFPEISISCNESYTLENLDSYIMDVDSELSYSFSGNDNISISYVDNSLDILPNPDWVGVNRIRVTATDDHQESVWQILTVIVRNPFLFSEDFDHEGTIPSGWRRTGSSWMPYLESGTDYAMRVNNPQLSSTQRLMTPAINLSGIVNPTVSFWHNLLMPAGVSATLQYSLNGFTYTNIENYTQSASGWYSIAVPQLENQSNVYIRWHYVSTTYMLNSWLIDDFSISGLVEDYHTIPEVQDLALLDADQGSITLSWTAITDNTFDRYEISVMADSLLSSELFSWSGTEDPLLYDQTQDSTQITGLTNQALYYFAIRSVDFNGNSSTWSCIIPAVASPPPVIQITTAQGTWFDSRSLVLNCQIQDDMMIDAASIRYRYDENQNGIYDPEETWTYVSGYENSSSLDVAIPLALTQDGVDIHFEISCRDTQNQIYSYSGFEHAEGIDDDLNFNVDTIEPAVVNSLFTDSVTTNSIVLSWETAEDPTFSHYEVYYARQNAVSLNDALWSISDDSALGDFFTAFTTITGLLPDSRYWFRILAVDFAGNKGELSNTVTNVLNSLPPCIYNPQPIQETVQRFGNSLNATIGCSISDAYGIDLNTVQYRYDANGDGLYGANEAWQNVSQRDRFSSRAREATIEHTINENGDETVNLTVNVAYAVEADTLRFEFRAKDIDGYGYSYSGFENAIGEQDDWYLSIDCTPPAAIEAVTLGMVAANSAEIYWTPSSDLRFTGYKIHYGHSPEITVADSSFSYEEYPALSLPGDVINNFMMTGLSSDQQYYVRVIAYDIAGNYALSDELSFHTSSAVIPLAPQNVSVTINGSDLLLSWDPVTEDIYGNPITIDQYLIYISEIPDFPIDGSTYYDTVHTNSCLFEGITDFVDKLFLRVIAVK